MVKGSRDAPNLTRRHRPRTAGSPGLLIALHRQPVRDPSPIPRNVNESRVRAGHDGTRVPLPERPTRGQLLDLSQRTFITSDYSVDVLREAWDGGEWQTHCRQLLAMRYGEDIQFVPDRDQGDGGLEAYRLDDGIAYQCYAAQDAFDVASLTEAQKRKIRVDIKKLIDNPARTTAIIGENTVLRRWVLLTPAYDSKELVTYARQKSIRTRTAPCPRWCHETFEIVVSTDELFAAERMKLYGPNSASLDLEIPEPTAEEVAAVATNLDTRLIPKLLRDPGLASSPEDLKRYKDEVILDYIRGDRQRQILETSYTPTFNTIRRRTNSTLRALTRFTCGSPSTGPEMANTLTGRLARELQADAPSLSLVLCEDLARHYVGRWFIECPLRFAPAS